MSIAFAYQPHPHVLSAHAHNLEEVGHDHVHTKSAWRVASYTIALYKVQVTISIALKTVLNVKAG